MKLFSRKFDKVIDVPNEIKIEYYEDKAKIIGSKNSIYKLISEFRKISNLNDNELCKFDKLTLKVSDYVTPDSDKPFWIEMPDHAWNIMASKFYDVWEGYDNNPFYFNDCAYQKPKNKYDLGIEIIDLPIRYEELIDGEFVTRIIERKR